MTRQPPHVPLPEGTRLVHIGPPKTGTTTLQGTFHARRAQTLQQGVRYAGQGRHSRTAVLAVTGRPTFALGDTSPPISRWTALAKEVRTAPESRVLLSSEAFADAEPGSIPRIIEDLGGDRVHVVLTLRPLAKILPSQWQQYVQAGLRRGFEPWLRDILLERDSAVTPTFWHRHRHDALVERWAEVVGTGHVIVVVVDDRDPAASMRAFEALLGLRAGTLVAGRDRANRSMTLPEIEAVRTFNKQFKAAGLDNELLHKVMHFGAATYMKRIPPSPAWRRIELPVWAADRAAEIAGEMVDRIRDAGVGVIGDLELLAPTPEAPAASGAGLDRGIPPEIAASMAMGVLAATGLSQRRSGARTGDEGNTGAEPPGLELVPTFRLAGITARRGLSMVLRSMRKAGRRLLRR